MKDQGVSPSRKPKRIRSLSRTRPMGTHILPLTARIFVITKPPKMSFLALDVGNTRLKWALFDSPKPRATLIDHGAVFLENIDRLGDNEWRNLVAPTQMLGCIVAGEAIRRRV